MDYFYFKFKNKEPFYYLKMSKEKKTVAKAYMLKFLEDKQEEAEAISESIEKISD